MTEQIVVIEDPRGSVVRHHWDDAGQEWIERPHPHTSSPWPVNYGYLPETRNPADDDDLDAMVLASNPVPTGARVVVRIVGLLQRPDGDDKLLGVLKDDPAFRNITRLQEVPQSELQAIETWFAEWGPVGQWQDEEQAIVRLEQAKRDHKRASSHRLGTS
jgi:inorganic pyrophosphatase